ncbi:MAG: hypothetical protein RSC25_00970 [Christensenella sp.]
MGRSDFVLADGDRIFNLLASPVLEFKDGAWVASAPTSKELIGAVKLSSWEVAVLISLCKS